MRAAASSVLVAVTTLCAGACGRGTPQAGTERANGAASASAASPLPADGVQPLEGMVTWAADGLLFAECRTGTSLPVSREGAYAALERAYADGTRGSAQPLLVRVRGSVVGGAPAGAGGTASLVVEAVDGTEPEGGCGEGVTDLPLEGTAWELVELGGSPLPGGVRATLRLDRSAGRASGTNGCNPFTGHYRLEGASLTFGDMAVGARACAGAEADVERAYFGILGRVGGYRLAGDALELLSEEGVVARFLSR